MRKNVTLNTALIVMFSLGLILISMLVPVNVSASVNISTPMAVLMDAQTGQVLYSKSADRAAYPASTTKIMTAVLALERGDLKDYVPISKKASYTEGSRIYLLEGERVTLEQLLYGLLLESGNDAAIAIAEHIAGSIEEFAVMMNDRAEALGAKNTNFTNPSGLPDPEHVVSAYDMALIAKHAMAIPEFREMVYTTRYIIPETNMQDTRYLYSGNRLIKNTSHKYEDANGIKTGYTVAAKHCFVGSARRDDKEFITVIFKEPNANALWANTAVLFDYAFDNFKQIPITRKGEVIEELELLGTNSDIRIITEEGFHYNYPADNDKPNIEQEVVMDTVKPTVPNGERVGYIEYKINDEIIGTVRLLAQRNDEKRIIASGMLKGAPKDAKHGGLLSFLLLLSISVAAFKILIKNRRKRQFSYVNRKSILQNLIRLRRK